MTVKHSAYNEKLRKDDVAELNVSKGVSEWRCAEGWDERVQRCVTVDNISIVMSWQKRQQMH